MFTVKVKYATGNQWLFAASEVTFVPPPNALHAGMTDEERLAATRPTVYAMKPDGHVTIGEGSVYVMNEAGATVSVWHFTPPPEAVEASLRAAA